MITLCGKEWGSIFPHLLLYYGLGFMVALTRFFLFCLLRSITPRCTFFCYDKAASLQWPLTWPNYRIKSGPKDEAQSTPHLNLSSQPYRRWMGWHTEPHSCEQSKGCGYLTSLRTTLQRYIRSNTCTSRKWQLSIKPQECSPRHQKGAWLKLRFLFLHLSLTFIQGSFLSIYQELTTWSRI